MSSTEKDPDFRLLKPSAQGPREPEACSSCFSPTDIFLALLNSQPTQQKREGYFNLAIRLSQLQPNDTMSLPIELPFLLYLIACCQWAGCPQSITRVMFAMDILHILNVLYITSVPDVERGNVQLR